MVLDTLASPAGWPVNESHIPTGSNVHPFQGNSFSLRAYPLHQCTRSIVLRLNDKEIQGLPMESINPRMEYWPPDMVRLSSWSCPHMRANAQDPIGSKKRSTDNPYAPMGYNINGDFSNSVVPNSKTRYYTFDYWHGQDRNYVPPAEGQKDTLCFEAVYDITEPILCEPLDYTAGKNFPRIMWNLTTFEVTMNIDDLANMFMVDKAVYQYYNNEEGYDYYWAKDNKPQWQALINRNNWQIEFASAPELIYKVYTPIPGFEPRTSFFSPYREYTLFKSMAANNVVVTRNEVINRLANRAVNSYDLPEYEINSGDISLSYFPNSVFIYVKQSEGERYGSFENRLIETDSYTKITGISVTYHNNTTIGQSLRADDIYEISLRNGLQGRTPLDYNLSEADYCQGYASWSVDPNYFNGSYFCGVGLVARFYPGLDFHTGNMSGRMIGGCKTDCNLISFKVKFQPLNLFRPRTTYQLFVLFEQEGGLVMDRRIAVVGIVGLKAVQQFDVDTTVDTKFYPIHISSHNYGAGWQDYVKGALSWFKRNKVASRLIGAFAPEDKAAKWGKRASAIEEIIPGPEDFKSGGAYRMRNGKVRRKRTKFYI